MVTALAINFFQTGLTALHIASIEGQTEMVRLILETAAQQKRFCFKKGDKKDLDSDLEVIINAKGPKVRIIIAESFFYNYNP